MIEEHDMEPMAAKDLSATPRFLFSLLALCVGLFVATFAVPAHAQAVAPDSCAEPAQVADDGDNADKVTAEGSVAVGCDSEVLRTHTREASESADQPLLTLDAGNDGSVDHYLVKVDCGMMTEMAACEGRTGVQYASVSEELYMRLRGVTEDPTTHLTEEEMSSLMTRLADIEPLGEIVVGLNNLVDDTATIMVPATTEMQEVDGGVAVGAGAKVKANGGVALGNGATVGADIETMVTLTMDETGLLVVGTETTTTGGGGDNGIAIGNGAKAMGAGSIAIGNGATAMEDDQVMIGTHDIGAMAGDVMENAAGVARNADGVAKNGRRLDNHKNRLDNHAKVLGSHNERLMAHGTQIEDNAKGVAKNAKGVMENAELLGSHNERLMAHGTKIENNAKGVARNAKGVMENAAGVMENAAGVAKNDRRLDNHDSRLDSHAEVLGSHNKRLVAHGTKIENNAGRINENSDMIKENSGKIGVNAGRINQNREMIGDNAQMLNTHSNMITNAMGRLDGHDTALTAHENRLNQHSTMLAGHAEGINNNAMQIDMLDERVSQVAAMSAALSAVPNAPDMDEKFFVGFGVGSHGGESGFAAGLAGRVGANKNIVVNAGLANSSGGTTVRAGVGWSF